MNTKKKLRKLGLLSILIGLLLVFNSYFANVTGNVVGNTNFIESLLGFVFFIIGLLLFLSNKGGLEVKVYDIAKGRKEIIKEKSYYMTDPYLYFSDVGNVSLSEFKRGINKIKEDKELLGLVRNEYGSQLLDIEKNSYGNEQEVAKEFLKILYPKRLSQQMELISKKEITNIRNAFDPGWKGSPDRAQSKILKEYGLVYDRAKKHPKIYFSDNPGFKLTVASTPSDVNAGKNIAREIVDMIKESRERSK